MFEKHENFIHAFYTNTYLKNRYPSPSYISQDVFLYPECPDLASVGLGYKPAVFIGQEQLNNDVNDYFLMKCLYAGKRLFYMDNGTCIIGDKEQEHEFRSLFKEDGECILGLDEKWGRLLGYPEHLVDLFLELRCGQELPDWTEYDKRAEEAAMKIFVEDI